jgi:type II secretory pathway pseudopilin PulG
MRMTRSNRRRGPSPSLKHTSQFGLSIVELLVGIAVGLFVLAGATMMASNQISDNKRLLLETQVQQDMRTAMDVIVRDVRRSGYSYHADALQLVGAPMATPIGYKPAGVMDTSNVLIYTYSSIASPLDNKTANPAEPADSPDFKGFKLEDEAIKVQLGLNNWQALTDIGVVRITGLTATQERTSVDVPTCATPGACPASLTGCGNPRVVTRFINLTLVGQAVHDPTVSRTLRSRVKVRNDEVCL